MHHKADEPGTSMEECSSPLLTETQQTADSETQGRGETIHNGGLCIIVYLIMVRMCKNASQGWGRYFNGGLQFSLPHWNTADSRLRDAKKRWDSAWCVQGWQHVRRWIQKGGTGGTSPPLLLASLRFSLFPLSGLNSVPTQGHAHSILATPTYWDSAWSRFSKFQPQEQERNCFFFFSMKAS